MEGLETLPIENDILGQILMHIQRLRIDIQTAKNLVNGKPIDADRKLQGVLTRCDNLIGDLAAVRNNELAHASNEDITNDRT
jgi:hypothetical protein